MKIILLLLALLVIVATVFPFFPYDQWWIRIFDFPRGQIAVAGLLVGAAILVLRWGAMDAWLWGAIGLLALCIVYQGAKIFPYTGLASKQVLRTEQADPDDVVTLLIANVLMTNRAAQDFIALVERYDPDLVLTVETDDWWEEQLRVLEEAYPHTLKHPLDNTYGMLLYSRFRLVHPEVKFLVKEDIPSMHAYVQLPSGRYVRLYALHPEPPAPQEADTSTERDAELLIVGKEVEEEDEPTIVTGDLNDVAWSYTTSLFQKVSGLLDPRIGRGMFNTFHAKYFFLRYPLDHLFHSDHFKLVHIERLPAWGSDHFPMLVRLSFEPGAEFEQEEPKADQEEKKQAEEKIEKVDQKESAELE